jgi:phospholipid transport system substrate-binding protein
VRGILNQVLAIQNDPALAGADKQSARSLGIRQIIQRSFDFPLMAQNSLGPAFGRLNSAQRREFVDTFSYLFQDSYARMVLNFLKQETIKYHQERLENSGARVSTSIIRTNETIPVDYLLHRRGQDWLLYDVIVDGVSILDNYKTQFAATIRTQSFESLLSRMKAQRRAIQ